MKSTRSASRTAKQHQIGVATEEESDDDEPPTYDELMLCQLVDASEGLTIAQVQNKLPDKVYCTECRESHAPYMCPKLSPLTSEQQQCYFRGKRDQLRRERSKSGKTSAAVRQLDVEESEDASNSDADLDNVDWRDFQMGDR